MHLVTGCDLLDRFVATERLKRNLSLEIRREPAPFRHICIPPQRVGIHLKHLSDFLGPPQLVQIYVLLAGPVFQRATFHQALTGVFEFSFGMP